MKRLAPRRRFADGGLNPDDPNYQGAVNTYLAQGFPPEMAQAMAQATGPNKISSYSQMTAPGKPLPPPAPAALPPAAPSVPSPASASSTSGSTLVQAAEPWKRGPAEVPVEPSAPAATPAASSTLPPFNPAGSGPDVSNTGGGTTGSSTSKSSGLLGNVQSPWLRALLAGGLGGLMGAGSGWGALGSGTIAALLTLLQKKKESGSGLAKGGTMAMPTIRTPRGRRMRFQDGGGVPPVAGMLPPGNPPVNPALLGMPPGSAPPAAPAVLPPTGAPLPGTPGMANMGGGGPGFPGNPPVPPMPPAALPQVAAPAAAIGQGLPSANLNQLRAGLGTLRPGQARTFAKGGKIDISEGKGKPKIQISEGQTMAKKRRPDAQWGDTDYDIENKPPAMIEKKAKGGKVLRAKAPKAAPKVSIAIVNKKSPVPTPSPYDMAGSPGSDTAPPPPAPAMAKGGKWIQGAVKKPGALHKQLGVPEGEKIPAKKLAAAAEKGGKLGQRARLAETLKTMHKRHGGECDDKMAEGGAIKLAAGGVGKLRKGYPDTNKPKKMATGGKVRGCGAATKGCQFSGIY